MNTGICVIGMDLETLEPVSPEGSREALGTEAMDLVVKLSLAPDHLDCLLRFVPVDGRHLPVHIVGTPSKPRVNAYSSMLPVLLRTQGSVGGLMGNVGGMGVDVANAIVDPAVTLGDEVVTVLKATGDGLLTTVEGSLRTNLEGVGSGLKQATLGTVLESVEVVSHTGEQILPDFLGLDGAVDEEDLRKWRDEIPQRWETRWEDLREEVRECLSPAGKRRLPRCGARRRDELERVRAPCRTDRPVPLTALYRTYVAYLGIDGYRICTLCAAAESEARENDI